MDNQNVFLTKDGAIFTHESYTEMVQKYIGSHVSLGSGSFGWVFEHPLDADKVIKIGKCKTLKNNNVEPQRDAYFSYLMEILKHQDNPYFPKIHDCKLHFYEKYDEYYYIVIMERLYDYHYADNIAESKKEKFFKKIGIETYGEIIDICYAPEPKKNICDKLKTACVILRKMFDNFDDDMHAGNVMWRKNPRSVQLVITDPVC